MAKTIQERLIEEEQRLQADKQKIETRRARIRKLKAQERQKERKARTKNLIEIGVLTESLLGLELNTPQRREAWKSFLLETNKQGISILEYAKNRLATYPAFQTQNKTETTFNLLNSLPQHMQEAVTKNNRTRTENVLETIYQKACENLGYQLNQNQFALLLKGLPLPQANVTSPGGYMEYHWNDPTKSSTYNQLNQNPQE